VIILAVDYVLIGKRLKKAREDKGITQEKLAEYLDVSNAYVSKIERGKTSLNLNTFSAICDYLGVSMSFIRKRQTLADSTKIYQASYRLTIYQKHWRFQS